MFQMEEIARAKAQCEAAGLLWAQKARSLPWRIAVVRENDMLKKIFH